MRPCGGFSPDMMNFANSTNVYKIWADMVAFDRSTLEDGEHAFCAYAGRRDGKDFTMSHQDILAKYNENLKMVGRIPDVLADAMGNQMYVATFSTKAKLDAFYKSVLKLKGGKKTEPAAEKKPVAGKAPAPKKASAKKAGKE